MAHPFEPRSTAQNGEGFRFPHRKWARKARPARPQGSRNRVLIEQLEPRLLLAADFALNYADILPATANHDIELGAVQSGAHASIRALDASGVQIARAFEAADGSARDSLRIDKVGRVDAKGTADSDRIVIDATSFFASSARDTQLPILSFDGAGGVDTLEIRNDATDGTWLSTEWSLGTVVKAGASGSVTVTAYSDAAQTTEIGCLTVDFTNVEAFCGTTGDDTFTVEGVGVANGADLSIDGGDEVFDSLVIAGGKFDSVRYAATDAHSGTIALDGATVHYAGLEPITQSSVVANLVIDASDKADDATLSAVNGTQMMLANSAGAAATFESITFYNPTESLTINLLDGADKLTVTGLSSGFAANLGIYGEAKGEPIFGSDGSSDKVIFDGDIHTHGGSIQVIAEDLTLKAGKTISTYENPGATDQGEAGYIEFRMREIDTSEIQNLAPVNFPTKSVSITVENGARIDADGIYLITQAEDRSLATQLGISSTLNTNFVDPVIVGGITDLLALPIKALAKTSTAKVTIGENAVLSGGSALGIYASSASDASGTASSSLVALGYAGATANATVSIGKNAELSSDGFVVITADADTTASMSSSTSRSLGSVPGSNSTQVALSLAIANSKITSHITVEDGASITAGLTANIKAGGNADSSASAESGNYSDGTAGAAIGLQFSNADIKTTIKGAVTSRNEPGAAVKLEFDPLVTDPNAKGYVDTSNGSLGNKINVGPHALATEDVITYTSSRGNNIGGLRDGADYYVIALEDNPSTAVDESHYIQLALSEKGAIEGTAIDLTGDNLGLPVATNDKTFDAGAVNADTDEITLDNSAFTGSGVNFSLLGQSFGLGQAVVYEEGSKPIAGLTGGNIYYIIAGTDQFNLGGDNRLVGTQVVKLAETENEARAGIAIDIGAPAADGTDYKLRATHIIDSGFATGVGVLASLDASTDASATAGLSKSDHNQEDPPAGYDLSKNLLENILGGLTKKYADKLPNTEKVPGGTSTDLKAAVSIALSFTDHDVYATAKPTSKLTSGEDLEVRAEIQHSPKLAAESKAEVQTDEDGKPVENKSMVSAAIVVGIYNNDAQATVKGGAELDGVRATRVISDVTYPYLTRPDSFVPTTAGEALDALKAEGYEAITKYVNDTLGIGPSFFNTWVKSTANASEVALAGSVNFVSMTNNSVAKIERGAKVNQMAAMRGEEQVVSVEATNYLQMIDLTGIFDFSLPSIQPDGTVILTPIPKYVGDVIKVEAKPSASTVEGERGGVGGAFYIKLIDNTTHAIVEDGAAVHSGSDGGFNMKAEEAIFNLGFSQSGAKAGKFAVGGTISVLVQNSDTLVQLGAAAKVTGRSANLYAGSLETHALLTGGVVRGEQVGVGVSISVNDIRRNTRAVIGTADPTLDPTATAAGTGTIDVDALSVRAINSGALWLFSVVGAVASNKPPDPVTDDPLDGNSLGILFGDQPPDDPVKTGVGAAGSVSINYIQDDVLASITGAGLVKTDELEITASNTTDITAAGGALAFVKSKAQQGGSSNQTGIAMAGAFGYNELTGDTRALVQGTNLRAGAGSTGDYTLDANRGGSIFALAAAIGGTVTQGSGGNATAVGIAASVGINLISGGIESVLSGSRATLRTGDLSVLASADASIISITGGLSLAIATGGTSNRAAAVGVAIAVNEIGNGDDSFSIRAAIDQSPVTVENGSVTVSADSESSIYSFSLGVAIAASGSGNGGLALGGAGSGSVNTINTKVRSEILGKSVIATKGAILVGATDNSDIRADAGGFALALNLGKGNQAAAGASFAVNNLTVDLLAQAKDTTLTAATQGSHDSDEDVAILAASGAVLSALTLAGALTGGASQGTITLAVAGAGSGNRIKQRTEALLSGSTVTTGAKGVLVEGKTTEASKITSDAGGVAISVSLGSTLDISVGVAVAVNEITGLDGSTGPAIGAQVLDSTITTAGDVSVKAASEAVIDTLSLAVAIGVSIGQNTAVGFSGAGGVSLNTIDLDTWAVVDDSVLKTTGSGDMSVIAADSSRIRADVIAGSVTVTSGKNAVAVSLGATVAVNDLDNGILAKVDGSELRGADVVKVKAGSTQATDDGGDPIPSISAIAVSVAGSVAIGDKLGLGIAAAGGFAFNDIHNSVEALVQNDSVIDGITDGDGVGTVEISAINQAGIFASADGAALSASFGQSAVSIAISAFVALNEIGNTVTARIDDSTVHADGAITVAADGSSSIETIGVGASFSIAVGAKFSFSGSGAGGYVKNVIENDITAEIVDAAANDPRVSGDWISVTAKDVSTIKATAFAGSISVSVNLNPKSVSISLSGAGVGAVNKISNDTLARIDNSNVKATGAGREEDSGDVIVDATSETTVEDSTVAVSVAVSVALASLSMSVAATDVDNTISGSTGASITGSTVLADGDVLVTLSDKASLDTDAVGVSVSGSVATVSVAVVTIDNVIDRATGALISDSTVTATQGKVDVTNFSDHKVLSAKGTAAAVAIGIGGAGAGVDSYAEVKNDVSALIRNSNVTANGPITVQADADLEVNSDANGGAASAIGVAVMLAKAIVSGSTLAGIDGAGTIDGGSINVLSDSRSTARAGLISAAVGLGGGAGGGAASEVSRGTEAQVGGDYAGNSPAGKTILKSDGLVDVSAGSTATATTTAEGGAGGAISVAAFIGSAKVIGSTRGHVSDGASVTAKGLSVDATSTETATAKMLAAAVGIASGAGAEARTSVEGATEAYIGAVAGATPGADGTILTIGSGGTAVTADSTQVSTADARGGGGGGLSIAGMVAQADIGRDVRAFVGPNTRITGGGLSVTADADRDADGTILVAAVAAIGGAGGSAGASIRGDTEAWFGAERDDTLTGTTTSLLEGKAVVITATESSDAFADSRGGSGGAIAVAAMLPTATVDTDLAAYIGDKVTVVADSMAIKAEAPLRKAEATLLVVSVSIAGGAGSTGTARVGANGGLPDSVDALAYIGANSSLTIGGAVSIDAITTQDFAKIDGDVGAGGGIAVAALIANTDVNSRTMAWLGKGTSLTAGSLSVKSSSNAATLADTLVGSGGLFAGSGTTANATTYSDTAAFIDKNAVVFSTGDVNVVADGLVAEADATARSYGGGGVDVGASNSNATADADIEAFLGKGSQVSGANILVDANFATVPAPAPSETVTLYASDNTIRYEAHGLVEGTPVVLSDPSQPDLTFGVLQVLDDQGAVDTDLIRFGAVVDLPAPGESRTFSGGAYAGSGSGVDGGDDKIIFAAAHDFFTGTEVSYSALLGATSISGDLGDSVFVRRIDEFTIQLFDTRAHAFGTDAQGNTDSASTDGLIDLGASSGSHLLTEVLPDTGSGVDTDTDVIRFAAPHHFTDGMRVVYQPPATGSFSPDLVAGGSYYVEVVDDLSIRLRTTASVDSFGFGADELSGSGLSTSGTVPFSEGQAVTYHAPDAAKAFTAGSVDADLSGGQLQFEDADNDDATPKTVKRAAGANNIFLGIDTDFDGTADQGPGFTSGQRVVYHVEPGGTAITNLVDGTAYYVIRDGNYAIKLARSYNEAVGLDANHDGDFDDNGDVKITAIAISVSDYEDMSRHSLTPADKLALPGLVDGQTYYVTNLDTSNGTTSFDLADADGNLQVISGSIDLPDATGGTVSQALVNSGHRLVELQVDLDAIPEGRHEFVVDLDALPGNPTDQSGLKLLDESGQSIRDSIVASGDGKTTSTSRGGGGGAIKADFPKSSGTLTVDVQAFVAADLVEARGDVTISAYSDGKIKTETTNGAGGVIKIGDARTTSNFTATSVAFLGDGARLTGTDTSGTKVGSFTGAPATTFKASDVDIFATGNFRMLSELEFDANASVTADGGGVIAGAGAYATNNVTQRSHVVVGDGARIEAETVDLTAAMGLAPAATAGADQDAISGDLKLRSYARAFAGGLFGASVADLHGTTTLRSMVLIEGETGSKATEAVSGTLITGRRGTDVESIFAALVPDIKRKSVFIGIGPSLGTNDTSLSARTLVDADAGATIYTAPRLIGGVNVHADNIPDNALATFAGYNDMALYVRSETDFDTASRSIVWDADVEISAGPSPELVVDENGNVLRAYNVKLKTGDNTAPALPKVGSKAYGTVEGVNQIEVADIQNGSLGSIVMSTPGGTVDQQSKGTQDATYWSQFRFERSFREVRITNLSGYDLRLNRINVINSDGQPRVYIGDVGNKSIDFDFDIVESLGESLVDIRNLGTGDVVLVGGLVNGAAIENPLGETRILNTGGNILAEAGKGVIRTNVLGDPSSDPAFKDFEFMPEARRDAALIFADNGNAPDTIRLADGSDWAAMGLTAGGMIRVSGSGVDAANTGVFQIASVSGDTITLTRAASLVAQSTLATLTEFHGIEATVGNIGTLAADGAYTPIRVDLVRHDGRSEDLYAVAGGDVVMDIGARLRSGSTSETTMTVALGLISAGDEALVLLRSALRENRSADGTGVKVSVPNDSPSISKTYYNFFDSDSGTAGKLGRGAGYDPSAVELGLTTYDIGLTEAGTRIDMRGVDSDGMTVRAPADSKVAITSNTNIRAGGDRIDVDTNGEVILTEIVAVDASDPDDLRAGLIRSNASDVTLAAPHSIIDATGAETGAGGLDLADVIGVNITMTAQSGTIGNNVEFLETDLLDTVGVAAVAGVLNADAQGMIRLEEVAGDLRVDQVAAAAGNVTLVSRLGSILDANAGADEATNVSGLKIDLVAKGGSIGLASDDLDIDSGVGGDFTGRLYADGKTGVYITEVADELLLLSAISSDGDVRLTLPDTSATPVLPRGLPLQTTVLAEDLLFLASGRRMVTENVLNDNIAHASVEADGSVALWIGDDFATRDNSIIRAGSTILIQADTTRLRQNLDGVMTDLRSGVDADAGFGSNMDLRGTIQTRGAESGDKAEIVGGSDVDLITFNTPKLKTQVFAYGQGGEDEIVVNTLQTMDTARGGRRDTLDLDGGANTDTYVVNTTGTFGAQHDYIINVLDSGAPDDGVDTLAITGSDGADVFLMRRITAIADRTTDGPAFVALLHADAVNGRKTLDVALDQTRASEGSGRPTAVQRINYDRAVNGRLSVYGLGGDDMFAVDGNSTITTLDGGAGDDRFQIGQLFGPDASDPDKLIFGLNPAPGDAMPDSDLIRTTRGYVSAGATVSLVAQGGEGNDSFTVYSNKAELRMEGDAGNDLFTVRAFALADENFNPILNKYAVAGRNIIDTGSGDDEIRYNINAPVSIDGGSGFDKVVVLGTEFNDAFVITKDGIYGGGVNVSYDHVEVIEVDGLEGDDEFFTLSTPLGVSTRLIGNLGSDVFNVGGDVTKEIVSRDLEGTSSAINHRVTSDGAYAGVGAEGVDVTVARASDAPVKIRELDASGDEDGLSVVREGDYGDRYVISLRDKIAAGTVVYVTISAARSTDDEDAGDPTLAPRVFVDSDGDGLPDGGDSILIDTRDPASFYETVAVNGMDESVPQRARVLVFDSTNWDKEQTIWIKAVDDSLAEGERTVVISHTVMVNSGGSAEAKAVYDGVAVRNVEVRVLDNDAAELIVTPTDGRTRVLEGAAGVRITDTFDVQLSRSPEAGETVTVSLAEMLRDDFGLQLSLSQSSITFDASNWNTPVTITVGAIDDGEFEDPKTVLIKASVSSTGGAFDSAASVSLGVEVLDNENAGVVVTESGGGTLVGEGETDDYTVRLTKAPDAGEVVTVDPIGDGQTEIVSVIDTATGNPIDASRLIENHEIGRLLASHLFDGAASLSGNTITRSDLGSFIAEGFAKGDCIRISGSGLNNSAAEAFLIVDEVGVQTLTLTTTGLVSETATISIDRVDPDGLFNGAVLFGDSALGDTITRTDGGSWLADRFRPGQTIKISGGANAGVYQIAALEYDDQNREMLRLTSDAVLAAGAGDIRAVRVTTAVTFDSSNWSTELRVVLQANTNYELLPGAENVKTFATGPHLLSALQGPLAIEGGVSGADRSLVQAVILPNESNFPPLGIGPQPDEAAQIDVVNIFNDGSREDKKGVLTSTSLTGLGMSAGLDFDETAFGEPASVPGGISFGTVRLDPATGNVITDGTSSSIEVLNIMLGQGNDTLRIDSTLQAAVEDPVTGATAIHGGVTAIHGGGNRIGSDGVAGGDTIIVDGGGGAESLLVIYGDTSQDGVWYSGDPATTEGRDFGMKPFPPFTDPDLAAIVSESRFVFPLATAFITAGNDAILGHAELDGSVTFTADASGATLTAATSWLDAGFRAGRAITVAGANDGSYRIAAISADGLTLTLEPTDGIATLTADVIVSAGASAGMITAYGGAGNDLIIGTAEGDHIAGGGGNDTVFAKGGDDHVYGDSGFNVDLLGDLTLYADDSLDGATKRLLAGPVLTVPVADATGLGVADPMVVGDDVLNAGSGNDIVFGDHGRIDITEPPLRIRTTGYDTIVSIASATIDDGGDDVIRGEDGQDILIGGANRVTAEVRGGDMIDGGMDQDLIFGDNATIMQHAADDPVQARDPRVVRLTAAQIYEDDGSANVDRTTPFADPRHDGAPWANFEITQLYHDIAYAARGDGQFGDDYIAGGASHDMIFGQLGDDVLMGDGSIESRINGVATVAAGRAADGTLSVTPSFEAQSDGDDYVEGGGGDDVIFGNLGQDDLIGGSSNLYSLLDPDQRPDGSDIIFGGAGTQIARNMLGTGGDSRVSDVIDHASDADTILGDNGNIFVLIDDTDSFDGPFLQFNYDQTSDIGSDPADPQAPQSRGTVRIIPRAFELLDYVYGDDAAGLGGSDLIYGEDGDDTIHAMTGNDVVYGNGHDDDIYGGTGDDRLLGGSGEDGILGDDGVIRTSRNGLAEPLNGIAAESQVLIDIPGPYVGAVVDLTGYIKKTINEILPESGGADLIYGGLGDDFLHGGAGDDAISGAEALAALYADTRALGSFTTPDGIVHTGVLSYNPDNRKLEYFVDPLTGVVSTFYDADNPLTKVANFVLNFDTFDASGALIEDGKDSIFGGADNDALFGGTGHDRLFGGWGDDYMQLDDNLNTNGGLNTDSDNHEIPAVTGGAGDFAYGGGGLDVLIANTGADRMFDWTGEFNTFVVPFSRFGAPTVNRSPSPHIVEFVTQLAESAGAGTTTDRAVEVIGLVTQRDPEWGDQHGAPRDPQPGNGHGAYDSTGAPEDDTRTAPLQTEHGSTPTLPSTRRPTEDISSIDIEKAINAVDPLFPTVEEDADTEAEALELAIGTPVVWTYLVQNTGTVALTKVTVTDSSADGSFSPLYVSGDDNDDGRLDPGETWLFSSEGVASHVVTAGLYSNTATVTAQGAKGDKPTDSDANFHFGGTVVTPAPAVHIEKAINSSDPMNPTVAEDADTGPGPELAVGSVVNWTYLVTNEGPAAVTVTALVDDNGTLDPADDFAPVYDSGDANGNGLLDTDEVWLYRARGVVTEGAYVNVATVTATDAGGVTAEASDPNHHTGVVTVPEGTAIHIEKAVNAADPLNPTAVEDADSGPGPELAVGSVANWTYLVTNVGDVPVTVTSLLDDNGTLDPSDDFAPVYDSGDANGNGLLDTDEVWLYRASRVVTEGVYVNIATVTVMDAGGGTAEASDPNHHTGVVVVPVGPAVHLEKAINAVDPLNPTELEDADSGPGPVFVVGQEITWTYLLSNEGDVAVAIDKVNGIVDDAGTPLDASDDFSPIYVSGDLDDDGLLDVGEVWLFTSEGATSYEAMEGSYRNVATVTATDPDTGEIVTDSDENYHAGTGEAAGHTPGFWKNNASSWDAVAWPQTRDGTLIWSPDQRLGSVFDMSNFADLADTTLLEALDLNGGGVNALLRHAVSALLSASHDKVAYPNSAPEVIEMTNAALTSGSNAQISALKDQFDTWNNLGSDLDQHGQSASYDALEVIAPAPLSAFTASQIVLPWIEEAADPASDYLVYDPDTGEFVPATEAGSSETVMLL